MLRVISQQRPRLFLPLLPLELPYLPSNQARGPVCTDGLPLGRRERRQIQRASIRHRSSAVIRLVVESVIAISADYVYAAVIGWPLVLLTEVAKVGAVWLNRCA